MTSPVVVPVSRVPWHSRHSGYDWLVRYLPHAVVVRPPRTRTLSAPAYRLLRRHSPLPYYPEHHFVLDATCRLRGLRTRAPFHFLYAESQLWFSRHIRSPIVASYHQPPANLERLVSHGQWAAILDRVAHVLVMAHNQVDFFAQYVPRERVHVAPHGVHADVFTPGPTTAPTGRPLVLTVGWWLRDWKTLRAVHERLVDDHGGNVELAVVTRDRSARQERWHPAVRVLAGISEPELIALYRRATVLALPLLDATANNALLEAMACGLPVVTTGVGGAATYTHAAGSGVDLVRPGDAEAMATAIGAVLDRVGGPAEATARQAVRAAAVAFDWPVVAELVRAVHAQVAAE